MLYINANGEYPRHIGDVQLINPDFKAGDELPDGWELVVPTAKPNAKSGYRVVETSPKKVEDFYYQQWEIKKLTSEELEIINAPQTAKKKLVDLGFTEAEIKALSRGLVK